MPGKTLGGGRKRSRLSTALIVLAVIFGVGIPALRITGLVIPYRIPTGAMTPALSAGDHVIMEGFTFLARKPRAGDIVVFTTDGILGNPPETVYVKRVAGTPGDRVRITDGQLFVNDRHLPLKNAQGEIHYLHSRGASLLTTDDETVTVPEGRCLVLGDNSANSADSRYWGFVAAKKIKGRISFCYWPPQNIGAAR